MITVKVKLPLNIRKGPGRSYKSIGEIYPSGKVILMDGVKEDGGNWKGVSRWYYKLNDKNEAQWYWGGRIEEVNGETDTATPPLPWGMNVLGIKKIWETFNELGANAKVAVLDSGYNILNADVKSGVAGFRSFLLADPENTTEADIDDKYGHGTHCASVIGGRNKIHITGYAPLCKLYIARISELGGTSRARMEKAIQWAIDMKVDIISISYMIDDKDDDFEHMVKKAADNNILVIGSIGNDGSFSNAKGGAYPALFTDCIAVGATDKNNQLAKVTLMNDKTEIYAPGNDIEGYFTTGTDTATLTGTSQAAAVVAGICALIVSRHRAINKPVSPDTVRKLLSDHFNKVVGAENLKLISPSKIFDAIKK